MKRNSIKLLFVAVCLAVAGFFVPAKGTAPNDLALHNIEALASGEGTADYWCIDEGSLECKGQKVKYIIRNYR